MGKITDYPSETTPSDSDVLILDGNKGTRSIAYEDLKNDVIKDIPIPDPELDIEKYQTETAPSNEDLLFLDGNNKGPRKIRYEDFVNTFPNVGGGQDGFSPIIAENPNNTASDYRLDITTASDSFTTDNLKGLQGDPGKDGKDGKSIASITTDDNNNLIVTFTDNTTQNIGTLNVDVSADFLTTNGFGNLRYYNGHFQYYDDATSTWIDTSVTPDNVYVMNMVPQPMQFINGIFDSSLMKYKLKWQEPEDTVINGQVACVVEKVIIRRKLGSVPENENDGDLVIEVKKNQFGSYKNVYFIDEELTANLGDVYYYKAFPLSTTGFYNASILNETSGILCKDFILYGFKIDQNESDPASMITYIEDNKNFKSAYMDYASDTFNYGDWADAFFMKVRPCMLKYDGTVDYYLNPNDYTKKEDGTPSDVANVNYGGNCMIQFPKIYWKIVDNGDNTANIYISDEKLDDKFVCWSHIDNNGKEIPYCYMPAYNGYNDGTRLRSLSDKTPINNQNGISEINLAKANNLTDIIMWYTEVMCDRQLVDLLLLLIGKSTDSQTVFGCGKYFETQEDSAINLTATGSMNNKGLFYGTNSVEQGVKVFGMEHWWGNQWRRTAGWVNVNETQKVKMTYGQSDGSTVDGYNTNGNGYITVPNAVLSGTNGGFISSVIFNENGIIPKTANGSATTYYTDGLWYNHSKDTYANVGGIPNTNNRNGIFALSLYWDININVWHVGASISCKPLAETGGAV